MHAEGARKNGGIGFAVRTPQAVVEAQPAIRLALYDERAVPMTPQELSRLESALEGMMQHLQLTQPAEIRIRGEMRTHVGMGSGTAIRLGAIESLARINGLDLPPSDLVFHSGRGGASGIGINTYFEGGLVCDLGIPNDGKPHKPSSSGRPAALPLVLSKVRLPEWPMLLCIPRDVALKTQPEEEAFFSRTAPIPASASFSAAYVALFEIYAGAVEGDYEGFCRGVAHMQDTFWKSAERAACGPRLIEIAEYLLRNGMDCVGMSSLGPMLFCFGAAERVSEMSCKADELSCDLYPTSPQNHGRSFSLEKCAN
jgi:beta-ribofuranosylaminobenzene 5'-phosphate synthase